MGESKYAALTREDAPDLYALLDEVLEANHGALAEAEAKVALAWVHDTKPDQDGHLVWGRAKKVGDLEREFHDHDFVIVLNAEVWPELPDSGRRALLDHELCHCAVKLDDEGNPTFRVRKHDVEEFAEIVRRHGLWKNDLEMFVQAALESKKRKPTPAALTETQPQQVGD